MIAATTMQTIFMVFYAIFWGVVANAQPKWRAFNWPVAFRYARTRRRLGLALIILNLLPILYFIVVFWLLGHVNSVSACLPTSIQLFLVVVAANAPFSIHRLWIALLERSPEKYYYSAATADRPVGVEPVLDLQGKDGPALDPTYWKTNLVVALLWLLLALAAATALALRCWLGYVVVLIALGGFVVVPAWPRTNSRDGDSEPVVQADNPAGEPDDRGVA